jgi:hypothetical protein
MYRVMNDMGIARRRGLLVVLIALLALTLMHPGHASAMAIVIHPGDIPDCTFEPGDVPGVDVFFPAQCTLVFTSSGSLEVVARGQLPAGFTLAKTFEGDLPCFGGTGHIVATKSGQVTATCQL